MLGISTSSRRVRRAALAGQARAMRDDNLFTVLVPLADLAQHATAAALALQFSIDHDFHAADECKDPCHKYTEADWLRLADEKLRND